MFSPSKFCMHCTACMNLACMSCMLCCYQHCVELFCSGQRKENHKKGFNWKRGGNLTCMCNIVYKSSFSLLSLFFNLV